MADVDMVHYSRIVKKQIRESSGFSEQFFLTERFYAMLKAISLFCNETCFAVALITICMVAGCAIGEGKITDQIPDGISIPIEQLPNEVMNATERSALPPGTTIERCDGGAIYRFNYPDGTIWMRDSSGQPLGGLI